ncbi:MAG: hypothetical protein OYH77_05900 [Pseudomonadota bacterium]|nr:hypothetical protein [Pseudomonadota bacterium]
MGRGDNRRTLKMRRRAGQAKKKQRHAALLAGVGTGVSAHTANKTQPVAQPTPKVKTMVKRARAASGEESS